MVLLLLLQIMYWIFNLKTTCVNVSKNALTQACGWLNHFNSNHGNGNIWVPQTPHHVLLFIVSLLSRRTDKPSCLHTQCLLYLSDNRGSACFLWHCRKLSVFSQTGGTEHKRSSSYDDVKNREGHG